MDRSSMQAALLKEIRLAIANLILANNRIAEQVHLHTTDMQILHIIEINKNVTPKLLADTTGMTTGGITVVLDRLEKMQLIERQKHPTDRRKVIISLNDKRLEEKFQDAYTGVTQSTFALMEQYSDEELKTITDFFTKLKSLQ